MVGVCAQAAECAGLRLRDKELALLCGAAPQLFEMIKRVRDWQAHPVEPANVFRFNS
jgi:hypothetical protein